MSEKAERLDDLRARNEFLESQLALYRDAVEHMPQALCVFDADGRIAIGNRRYEEVVRLPAGSVHPGLTTIDLIQLGIDEGHYTPGKSAEEIRREILNRFNAEGGSAR